MLKTISYKNPLISNLTFLPLVGSKCAPCLHRVLYRLFPRHIVVIIVKVICHVSVINFSLFSTGVGRVESAILQELAQPFEQCKKTRLKSTGSFPF